MLSAGRGTTVSTSQSYRKLRPPIFYFDADTDASPSTRNLQSAYVRDAQIPDALRWPLISKYPQYRPCSISSSRRPRFLRRQNLLTTGTGWHKKAETFENPNKYWRNPRKKITYRNWTTTTCSLRDSNPNYQFLKITSCRWRPPPRMHSFTATTHFKSSRSFVSPCVCCMLCRACNTHRVTQKNGYFWNA